MLGLSFYRGHTTLHRSPSLSACPYNPHDLGTFQTRPAEKKVKDQCNCLFFGANDSRRSVRGSHFSAVGGFNSMATSFRRVHWRHAHSVKNTLMKIESEAVPSPNSNSSAAVNIIVSVFSLTLVPPAFIRFACFHTRRMVPVRPAFTTLRCHNADSHNNKGVVGLELNSLFSHVKSIFAALFI